MSHDVLRFCEFILLENSIMNFLLDFYIAIYVDLFRIAYEVCKPIYVLSP